MSGGPGFAHPSHRATPAATRPRRASCTVFVRSAAPVATAWIATGLARLTKILRRRYTLPRSSSRLRAEHSATAAVLSEARYDVEQASSRPYARDDEGSDTPRDSRVSWRGRRFEVRARFRKARGAGRRHAGDAPGAREHLARTGHGRGESRSGACPARPVAWTRDERVRVQRDRPGAAAGSARGGSRR